MSETRRAANPADPTKWVAPSGATSSALKPEYRLVPFATIRRIGQRLTDGARKHGEGNWEKALDDRTFMMDRANHLIEHAYKAIAKLSKGVFTDDDDDDLGGIGANLAFLISYQEHQRNFQEISSVTAPEKIAVPAHTSITLRPYPICLNCGHTHYYESGDFTPMGKCRDACECTKPQYTSSD
jgi:dATP/dGTP diphosphohydrolase